MEQFINNVLPQDLSMNELHQISILNFMKIHMKDWVPIPLIIEEETEEEKEIDKVMQEKLLEKILPPEY